MDSKWALFSGTLGLIVAAAIASLIVYIVRDQLQAGRNRVYKTLADHTLLNASDRAIWATGQLPDGEDVKVDLSSRIVPIVQLAIVAVLVVTVLVWNEVLAAQNTRLEQRLSVLELQIHALALSPGAATPARAEPDGETAQQQALLAQPSAGTPLQVVCANLIGRVADAYQKGESSKIGQSLEELVNKMGCQKILAPP
jgi:hypothetical protein